MNSISFYVLVKKCKHHMVPYKKYLKINYYTLCQNIVSHLKKINFNFDDQLKCYVFKAFTLQIIVCL